MAAASFLSKLFASLESSDSSAGNSTAPSISGPQLFLSQAGVKETCLTLHCIFPDHLLPSLDLLERGNVHRLDIKTNEAQRIEGSTDDVSRDQSATAFVHYVETSTQRRGRFSQAQMTRTFYEVRLDAWNCTCPAFSFTALEGELEADHQVLLVESLASMDFRSEYKSKPMKYGGLAEGEKAAPMCKHLMACLLANSNSALRVYVNLSLVTPEEAAAWTAGWVS